MSNISGKTVWSMVAICDSLSIWITKTNNNKRSSTLWCFQMQYSHFKLLSLIILKSGKYNLSWIFFFPHHISKKSPSRRILTV